MKTTFKSYYFSALLEEQTDLPIYQFDFDDMNIDSGLASGFQKIVDFCKEGLLIKVNPNLAIGFKEDILRAFKKEGFSAKEIEANLELLNDYVASKFVAQRQKSEINTFIENIMNKLLRPLVYGIKVGTSSSKMVGQNVLIIHKKSDDPLGLEFTGGGKKRPFHGDFWPGLAAKHGYSYDDKDWDRRTAAYNKANDEWLSLDNFLFIQNLDNTEFDPHNDPNYQWIVSHLHEITKPEQKEKGMFVFHLPAPRREDLLIYGNGYVRIDPKDNSQLRMLHKPEGETSAEKIRNAFEAAAKWVKKNL